MDFPAALLGAAEWAGGRLPGDFTSVRKIKKFFSYRYKQSGKWVALQAYTETEQTANNLNLAAELSKRPRWVSQ